MTSLTIACAASRYAGGRITMTAVGAEYRQILDALADPIIAADASNRIVYANRAVERLLDWPPDELLGQPLSIIQPERFRQAHLDAFNRFLATRVLRVLGKPLRVSALCRDGTEIEVDVAIAAVPEEGEPLVVASLRDRRARAELERAEQRFAFLAEASRV